MKEMKIFENEEFGSIRTVVDGEKYFFCGMDVARALGYKDTVNALKAHCKEDGVAFYHLTYPINLITEQTFRWSHESLPHLVARLT